MLNIENTILDVAEKLELIDRTHKTQLKRLGRPGRVKTATRHSNAVRA
jgi:hypothetical protein